MSPASNELPGFFICHTIYIFAEKDKATIVVEIRNKDFQTVVNNYAKRALNAAKEAIGSGNTESISEQDFQQYFLE